MCRVQYFKADNFHSVHTGFEKNNNLHIKGLLVPILKHMFRSYTVIREVLVHFELYLIK